jgi:hypothetical protein
MQREAWVVFQCSLCVAPMIHDSMHRRQRIAHEFAGYFGLTNLWVSAERIPARTGPDPSRFYRGAAAGQSHLEFDSEMKGTGFTGCGKTRFWAALYQGTTSVVPIRPME